MNDLVKYIKGIHPGLFLERELRKRKIGKGKFALSIQEYPQTLVAVMKGKRRMNPNLALRVERALSLEEGTLLVLQAYFDLNEEKVIFQEQVETPDLNKFRPTLFWEVDIKKLNWSTHAKAIIQRVMTRGNQQEKDALVQFYGTEKINQCLK